MIAQNIDPKLSPWQVVAIDGGAGTGKTTICLSVARRLGYGYLNTGAFYRCLALKCLRSALAHASPDALLDATISLEVTLDGNPDRPRVYLDGADVTQRIRQSDVTDHVSAVSCHPGVRRLIVARQRVQGVQMASEFAGIVADGRDVTKVVFPFAAVRVLLVTPTPGASLSAHTRTPEEVARDVERDRKDAVVTGFNVPEKGVIFLDSSKLTGEAIIEQVVGLALDARYRSADARGSRCGPHTDEIVRGKPRVQRET